jgi:membrane protease YdiL (CAAX protease family)
MVSLAYLAVAIALGLIVGLGGWRPAPLAALLLLNAILLPVVMAVYSLLTGVFENKPLGSVGLAFHERWRSELGLGLAIGAVMVLLVAGLERFLGLAAFHWSGEAAAQLLSAATFAVFLMLISAASEEVLFRGYPFQRLVDAIGPVGAVLVFSGLFGIVHLGNPHHTWISTANTMLVGIPLAVAYLRTRALWMPIGIHFAWNFVQGYGLGLPVSGLVLPGTAISARVQGGTWLTGGAYGPEGGLLATPVFLAATVYVLFSGSIYVSKEMKDLVFGSSPEQPRAGRPELG